MIFHCRQAVVDGGQLCWPSMLLFFAFFFLYGAMSMYTLVNGVVTYVDGNGEVGGTSAVPVLRSAYSDHKIGSDDSALKCADVTLAQQHFKDECDINTLVERFGLGYEAPKGLRVPVYGDFTGINDFHTAANRIAEAHEAFDQLPAAVRYRFANDPYEFVAFCSDEKNRGELDKWGMLLPPQAPPGTPAGAVVAPADVVKSPEPPQG